MNNSILVSVCCITYNHSNYIRQCLESILNQKTDFQFEVLINDDASTDGTVNIIKEFKDKFPNTIKPIYHTENKYSKGIRSMNARYNFPRTKGKYIAFCEGDDFWTDLDKLQKQIDFLEKEPDYGISCHEAKKFFEKDNKYESTIEWRVPEVTSIKDLSKWNIIVTNSAVLRNDFEIPEWYFTLPVGDWPLHIIQIKNRKIHRLPEEMSVYRIHESGVWTSTSEIKKLNIDIDICEKLLLNDVTNNPVAILNFKQKIIASKIRIIDLQNSSFIKNKLQKLRFVVLKLLLNLKLKLIEIR